MALFVSLPKQRREELEVKSPKKKRDEKMERCSWIHIVNQVRDQMQGVCVFCGLFVVAPLMRSFFLVQDKKRTGQRSVCGAC